LFSTIKMLQLKKLFDFYINSSLHVGLAVVAYAKVLSFSIEEYLTTNWFYFIFFGTVAGYNLLKYFSVYSLKPRLFTKSHSRIFWVTFVSFFIAVFCYLNLDATSQSNLLLSGLIFIFYPFCRKIWFLKTFSVALCVTLFIFASQKFNLLFQQYGLVFFKFFLFIMASLIPFEIIDHTTDKGRLQTITQKFGIQKTKIIGCFLVIFFLITNCFIDKNSLIDTVIGLVMIVVILFSTTQKSKYYTSFWGESIPILWYLLLLFSSNTVR
jgi:hypothetical protein